MKDRAITEAAINWWERKRPVSWVKEQHFEHPSVNCSTTSETELAVAVSAAILKNEATADTKYYCLEIEETVNGYEFSSLIRIRAKNKQNAAWQMKYWLGHWYPTYDDKPVEPVDNVYEHACGAIFITGGHTTLITKEMFYGLQGLIPEMTVEPEENA